MKIRARIRGIFLKDWRQRVFQSAKARLRKISTRAMRAEARINPSAGKARALSYKAR